jgi:protein-S-isoprenylcysteine O-methyltransferase Ste14
MSYKDLPLEQRMELASRYALLSVADDKTKEEIIGILKSDYELTESLAAQAYANMRSKYKKEYDAAIRSNIFKGLGSVGVSLFAFLIYYLPGKAMGRLGIVFMILGILFAFWGVVSLLLTIDTIWERDGKPRKPDQVDQVLYILVTCAAIGLFFVTCENFFESDMLDLDKIVTVENCIITEPVRYESTGGKYPRHYYALKVRGHNVECRFFDKYYEYSNKAFLISELKEWDTVSMQMMNKYSNYFEDQYSTGDIEILNLGRHGRFLIDHPRRNAQIKKALTRNFHVLLAVLGGVIMLLFLKNLYHLVQHSRQPITG